MCDIINVIVKKATNHAKRKENDENALQHQEANASIFIFSAVCRNVLRNVYGACGVYVL
jgi:hypothetical protein